MSSGWQSPSKVPPLPFDGVQVWRLQLDGGPVEGFYRLLNPEEKRRADGMRIARVREEFVAGRGLLRHLLGAATGMVPEAILLESGSYGKPCLAPFARLEFNVSHSDGMILIALSRACAVGVDVEFVSGSMGDAEEIAAIGRDSFDASEVATIVQTPAGHERLLAFYRAWTRREAVAKADGRGIASLLKYRVFEADELGECRVALCGPPQRQGESGEVDYHVQMPDASPHHIAAVACRAPGQALALFDAALLRV